MEPRATSLDVGNYSLSNLVAAGKDTLLFTGKKDCLYLIFRQLRLTLPRTTSLAFIGVNSWFYT